MLLFNLTFSGAKIYAINAYVRRGVKKKCVCTHRLYEYMRTYVKTHRPFPQYFWALNAFTVQFGQGELVQQNKQSAELFVDVNLSHRLCTLVALFVGQVAVIPPEDALFRL